MPKEDGGIVISANLDPSPAEKKLGALKKKIKDLQDTIDAQESAKSPLVKQADDLREAITAAKREAEEYKAAWQEGASGADSGESKAVQKASELRREYDKVVNQIDKIDAKLIPAHQKMDSMQEEAGRLEKKLQLSARGGNNMADAIKNANGFMDKFLKRVKRLAARVFVFSLITAALRSIKNWFGEVLSANAEAQKAIANLKGALLTLAQPLIDVVVPGFIFFVQILTKGVTALARVISSLFGKTITESAAAAKALYADQQAMKAVGKEARKTSKSLAGFDDLNIVSDSSGQGGSDLSAGTAPDFSGVVSGSLNAIAELLTGTALLALGAILTFSGANLPLGIGLMVAGAALVYDAVALNGDAVQEILQGPIGVVATLIGGAFLVVGALLAFTGANIPLGIALMAAGALEIAAAASSGLNWNTIKESLQGPIGDVAALVGMASLVVGAILAFSGANLGLGIALMAAGALELTAYAAANWDTVQEALQGPIGAVAALVGTASLVLGAILAFSGANLPLGIGLMAAGAATVIAMGASGVDWNTISDALQGPIGAVTASVSGALLALGAILTFSGANLPLGIGLMVAGALGLTASIAANWDTIVDALRGPMGIITAIVGGALLVLGIILLFTGAGIPLGLGLVALGAAGLAAAIAPNWNFLLDKLKGMWQAIKDWWYTYIVPAFNAVKDFFSGIFTGIWDFIKKIINSILGGIESMANGVIRGINWVIDALNKLHFDIPDWVPLLGGKSFGFNINSLSEISIPRLAAGAVIPPNREFLAVLGDQRSGMNIEAPADLIRQIVAEELDKRQAGHGDEQPTWIVEGSMAALVRDLRVYMQKADRRVSVRLVEGGI